MRSAWKHGLLDSVSAQIRSKYHELSIIFRLWTSEGEVVIKVEWNETKASYDPVRKCDPFTTERAYVDSWSNCRCRVDYPGWYEIGCMTSSGVIRPSARSWRLIWERSGQEPGFPFPSNTHQHQLSRFPHAGHPTSRPTARAPPRNRLLPHRRKGHDLLRARLPSIPSSLRGILLVAIAGRSVFSEMSTLSGSPPDISLSQL
jgi:hypothetical protein